MKNYLITLMYDGSRYSGWQRQGNTGNTIEAKLQAILYRMTDNKTMIEVHGSGRTDAGVHAKGQKANFKLDTDLSTDEIMNYFNEYLPEDIKVTDICIVADNFHARLSAKRKIYEYTIDMSNKADVFMRKYAWNVKQELNVEIMKQLADYLLGEHDFRGFSDMKKDKKSSVRTIYDIQIERVDNILKIRYMGNGFLYHMVRKLTSFLVEGGMGKTTAEDMMRIFEICDKSAYKGLAPAYGLMLMEVIY